MSDSSQPLQEFGQFLMKHLRDETLAFLVNLEDGHWKSYGDLSHMLQSLRPDQKEAVKRAVTISVDHGIHQLLFAIHCSSEEDPLHKQIQIVVDGKNIAHESDGLQGEPYGSEGWIEKYSTFPEGEN